MVDAMKKVAKLDVELTVEERNLLSVGYKNVVGARRASWRILSSIEQKEETKGNEHHVKSINEYRHKVESELSNICTDIIALIDEHLIPSASAGESSVFYYKMLVVYKYHTDSVLSIFMVLGGLITGRPTTTVTWRSSSLETRERKTQSSLLKRIRACHLAKEAFDEAISELDTLSEESYKDSTLIMQLLRDNLTLWTSDIPDDRDSPQHLPRAPLRPRTTPAISDANLLPGMAVERKRGTKLADSEAKLSKAQEGLRKAGDPLLDSAEDVKIDDEKSEKVLEPKSGADQLNMIEHGLHETPEAVELKAMILAKEEEVLTLLEENMIFKRRAEEEAAKMAAAAGAREHELKTKIESMEEELKESNARAAELVQHLAAAEGTKARLEAEMRRLRAQTEQWRKAAEAAVTLLATAGTPDKHLGGGYIGLCSPLIGGESEEEMIGGARRKAAVGIRMFGELWKKRIQQQQ
ncbi:hypothetical protein BHE74_00025145 [Ensete ventricosum]|nr:hypothetical protein BHE74_00025145 [Ensete ventricosum]